MVRISAIFLHHRHRAIIFYFSATATCATSFSSRQLRGGAKSGASALPSTDHLCFQKVMFKFFVNFIIISRKIALLTSLKHFCEIFAKIL